MRHLPILILIILLTAGAPLSASELIEKNSPHAVATVVARLTTAIEDAGATVFAIIDHTAGARSVGIDLPAAQVLVFGNPRLGTPAMQDNIRTGLDLPLRVLVYSDENGDTKVAYHAPDELAEDHQLPADSAYLRKMTGALDKLTTLAAE
ncbi:DUF302 domain-containing protein [Luminiphilus syltensis]|nr:DUF302 domain-containing protein [Luminiphilus syltensis]